MATIAFEAYIGTPAWTDISTNRLTFSGSASDCTVTIAATNFQTGSHVSNGTPGTDQCGATHANNVKWLTDTTMSVNGAASEIINDTNLADAECTMRIHFNDATAYAIQNARFYCYDNATTTNFAVGVDVAAYIKAATADWFNLNDATTTGATGWITGSIGGDNSGERIDAATFSGMNRGTAATDQYWLCGISASPETAGGKSSFAFGWYCEYY